MRRLVDAHTHLFPDRAYGEQWQRYLGHDPRRAGTFDELTALMAEGSIDHAVILLYPRSGERFRELVESGERDEEGARAQVAAEIRRLNRWGCELAKHDQRLVPFVGVNVRFMSAEEIRAEIAEMHALGAQGVKIILPSMQLYATDPLLQPVFQACVEFSLPLLSQSGSGGGPPPPGGDHYGRPRYYDDVLSAFPDLRLILAHMGLSYEEDVVALTARHGNVYTDTSLRLGGLGSEGRWTAEQLVDTIRRIGTRRVLFGSNFPMANPAVYARVLDELPLEADEREDLAVRNFERVMGLAT